MQGAARRRRRYIAAVAAAYLCFGMAWIVLSDALLAFVLEPAQMQRISTAKGLFFVLLSAALGALAVHHAPVGEAGDGAGRTSLRDAALLPRALGLLAALLLPLVALCVRAQLDGVSGGRPMFLLYMLPITLSALLGGLLPGLWATVVSGLLTTVLTPDLSLRDDWLEPFDRLQWGLLMANGVVVSLLSASLLRSLQHQQQHRRLIDAILAGTPDAIWVRDPAGRLLLANPAATALDPSHVAELSALEQRTLEEGQVHNLETQQALRDGPLHHFQMTVGPVPDAQGASVAVFSIARDISDLHDSLQVLSRSQAALTEAQQVGAIGSWERDLETGEARWSLQMRDLFGIEALNRPPDVAALAGYFSAATWPALDQALQRARTEGTPFECDAELQRADGSRDWVTVRGRGEHGRDGRPLRLSGTVQDISARKRTELALADREQQLRRVLEASDQGFWDWDLQTQTMQVSPNLARLLGRVPGELPMSRERWGEFVHPEDLAQVLDSVERHLAGEGSLPPAELRCCAADGSWRRLLVRGGVARDATGRPLTLSGTFSDITERHQLELALREAQTVFERSDEGIMFCDAQLRITKVNPALCAITGYSPEEVLGQNPRLFASGRHDAAFYAALWASLNQHGRWRGEIWNRRKNGEEYAEVLSISVVRDSHGQALHYIAVFTDISLLKRHEADLEHMLHYDPLTGAANRRLLTDRLQQALARARRSGKALAVCMLDLDGFHVVNEAHGESGGNRLLVGLTHHLQQVLRADDTLARLGGDEFVLLLTELHNTQECTQVLDRVLEAARQSVEIGAVAVSVSASVGVTLYPDDLSDPDTLLRHADQAMYQAKNAGRDRYQLFDPEAERRAQAERSELLRLQEAHAHAEFTLFYQPKIALADGRLAGVEALIRWQHPQRGLVPPGEFLHHLPGSALELSLGDWVIATAWEQAVRWHREGRGLTVSVNISAHQLLAPGFVDGLRRTLARHPDAPAELLELEVLESAAIGDMDQAVHVMRQCRALGLHFALDDFGTGYSSLTYLRQLPVDVLKIDQSFIRNMLQSENDLGIVVGVIGLARAFRLQVVAEGVETLAHAHALRDLGCECAQGYGISRPLPLAALEAWRAAWRGLPTTDAGA